MADPTAEKPLNIRENRAGARAAVGHADVLSNTGIATNTAEAHIVGKATERLAENDWRKTLETIGEEPNEMHWGSWQDVLPGQVFTEVDAAGNRIARVPEETQRRDRITGAMRGYDALLRDGYPSLPPGPIRNRLNSIVEQTIRSSPQLREIYMNNATPPVVDVTRIPQLLEDPTLKKHLAEALNGLYDPTKQFPMIDVQKAVEAYTKSNTELNNLISERLILDTKLGKVLVAPLTDQTLTETFYNADTNPGIIAPGTRGTAITNHETTLRGVVLPAGHEGLSATSLGRRQTNIRTADINLERLGKLLVERVPNRAEIDRVRALLDDAGSDSLHGARVREYRMLVEGRQALARERAEAEARVTALNGEITTKTAETNVKRAEQQDKLRDAKAHSAKFERQVDRALAIASKNTIGEKVATYLNGYRAAENESLELAKEEQKHHISEELHRRLTKTTRRWINYLPGTGWLGNNKREVLNERQIRGDARVLFREGPQALVDRVLRAAHIPDGERELLLRDESFMRTQGKEMYGKVLAGYIMTGGKIASSQYEALAMSDWGPDVLTEMISKNAEAQALIKQHTGEPYTEQSIRKLLADPKNQKWIKAALYTAGGLGLFYAGPAGIAAGVSAIGSAANYVAGDAAGRWIKEAGALGTAVASGAPGVAIGHGIDAGQQAAQAIGTGVANNVTAIGANSTALQGAGAAINTGMQSADASIRAGGVGEAIGRGAKYAVDTATTTGQVIATNVATGKKAFGP